MSLSSPKLLVLACIIAAATVIGCNTNPPVYLRDQGDLSYYIEQATDVEYPDVHTAQLDEVSQALPPITVSDPDFQNYWDLTLEDCVSISLQNSKVLRGYGTPGISGNQIAPGVDNLTSDPAGVGTLYNVAVRETEPGIIGTPGQVGLPGALVTNTALDANQGVEAALAEFDAQVSAGLYWDKSDQQRNTTGGNSNEPVFVFQQDQVTFQSQIAKRTAVGTQLFVRTNASYTNNNTPPVFRPIQGWYDANLELEMRQPLARGRGAFINRMPVVISRIGTDQEIANLETQLDNVITNIEIRYWDLWCAYKLFAIAQKNLNEAALGWRRAQKRAAETGEPKIEYGPREQYFSFQAEVKRAWSELIRAENDLRWLLGVANTDGNIIRPVDEPTRAEVRFDWSSSLDEAIGKRPELRQQRWEIKKKQLALAYAKNSLLPNINAVALYRFLGAGDRLADYNNPSPGFPPPTVGSGALNSLADGKYQEFRLGLDFAMPVGYRRELSNVRNAQIKLVRSVAIVEDLELEVARELSQALQVLDANYQIAVEQLNRFKAASAEAAAEAARYAAGNDNFLEVVDARRRRDNAEIAFFRSLCEYNKAIAMIHRRKGTTMEFSGVAMAEGPWPAKAYDDAAEHSRRRSSSRAVNYGFTRPEVISQGSQPICGCDGVGCNGCGTIPGDGSTIPSNEGQQPRESINQSPTPAPLPKPKDGDEQASAGRNQVVEPPVHRLLTDSIARANTEFARPLNFDKQQVPNQQSHQNALDRFQASASAQIRLLAPPSKQQTSLADQMQAMGQQPVTHSLGDSGWGQNRLRIINAETVGSGLRTPTQINPIRQVNYEE